MLFKAIIMTVNLFANQYYMKGDTPRQMFIDLGQAVEEVNCKLFNACETYCETLTWYISPSEAVEDAKACAAVFDGYGIEYGEEQSIQYNTANQLNQIYGDKISYVNYSIIKAGECIIAIKDIGREDDYIHSDSLHSIDLCIEGKATKF